MEPATAIRRWGYVGGACAAFALSACPQVLGDDFLLSRDLAPPDAGVFGGAGSAGAAAGQAGASGRAGAEPDAAAGGSSGVDGQGGTGPAGASCSDAQRNQDETGIDCGGVCPACCQFGPFHDVVQVEGLSADDRFGPMLSSDGSWLYFSLQTTDNAEDLYRATRTGTSTVFTGMEPVPNLNGSTLEGSPFLSSDGRTLYFFSDRMGGVGSRDLWMATRASLSEEFSQPVPVPGVNSNAMDLLPRLSPDGLSLLFESTRNGSSDIWAAERATPTGAFGTPHLRTDLSSSARDEGLSLSRDQLTVVIASTRGGSDMALWMATRATPSVDFGAPMLISELNSSEEDIDPALSADGREIFFVSTRDGDYRIYHAVRDCL